MRSTESYRHVIVSPLVLLLSLLPGRTLAVEFAELTGWWHAPVEHAGQQSEVYLHLLVDQDKPSARLSMVAMDAWDVPIGTVQVDGDRLDMTPYPFPLAFNREHATLSGVLPEAAVPVYRIPVTFRRVEPPHIPAPRKFDQRAPETVWSLDSGAPVWAGLALDRDQDLLVVANDAGRVLGLAPDTGRVRWQRELGAAIRARPTIAGKSVYCVADDGRMSRLDLATGREEWRVEVDSGGPPRIEIGQEGTRYDRYASAVTVDGEWLFVGGRDGAVHALDARDGRERWQFRTGDIVTASPALAGDLVLVASFDGNAYGIEARSGKERWRRNLQGVVPGDVVVANGIAMLGSRSYDLYALDAATGTTRWQYYYWFSWIESPARVVDGVAYIGSSDALSLFAFDLASGRLVWQRKVPGWAWPQAAVAGDTLFVATIGIGAAGSRRQGAVTAVDRHSGEIRWVHLGEPVAGAPQWGYAAAPAADGSRVYAADLSGRIVALRDVNAADASRR